MTFNEDLQVFEDEKYLKTDCISIIHEYFPTDLRKRELWSQAASWKKTFDMY